jgi:hypothetical protein
MRMLLQVALQDIGQLTYSLDANAVSCLTSTREQHQEDARTADTPRRLAGR